MFSNFLCGAVIDFQDTATTAYIDSTFRQSWMIAINTLMGVAHNEDVIRMFFPRKRSNQAIRVVAEILALIDYDTCISRFSAYSL